jgi:hypothetical protein
MLMREKSKEVSMKMLMEETGGPGGKPLTNFIT